MEIKADLSQSALVISLPQAYLEYTYPDWDPPSRWDDGISGSSRTTASTHKPGTKKMAVMIVTRSAATGRSGLTWGDGAAR
ncbi:FimD/PapC N-terminal domain-containing protein [Escherichia coli]